MIPLMPLMTDRPATRRLRITIAAALVIGLVVGSVVTVRAYQRDQAKVRAAGRALDASLAHETQLHDHITDANEAAQAARAATADHQRGTRNEDVSKRHDDTLTAAAFAATANAQQSLKTSTQLSLALGSAAGQAQKCLAGEQSAMHNVQSGNSSAAIAALNSGAAACSNALAGATGARFPYDFPDPFVLTVGGRYYAFSTNSGAGDVQVITSTNLVNWSFVGNALAGLPSWANNGSTWAPAVLHLAATPATPGTPAAPGKPAVPATPAQPEAYVMYYTVRDRASGDECLSTAVSAAPTGPYFDRTQSALVCESSDGGSIDPTPFVDSDGSMYLLWKRERAVQPATLQIQRLTANGRALTGPSFNLLQSDRAWQHGVMEAPSMIHAAGTYYLFFAGGFWNTATYATGVAQCDTPIGPCHELPSPVMVTNSTVVGPGGASVFTDNGGAVWLAYAGYANPFVGWPFSRTLRFARVTFSASGVHVIPA
jgi:hypothetical protein